MQLLFKILSKFLFSLLKLRYKFKIKGLEELDRNGKGYLFLPNHPAEIDPIIMIALLNSDFHPRPLAVDHFFHMKGAKPFMDFVNALPIPNFETSANSWKIKRGEQSLKEVEEGLRRGENFLIYPSGNLRRSPRERIGGSSFVHQIAKEVPEANVVLVRTNGLWGSMFSRALTGKSPDFWKTLSIGVKTILKNGIFFVPKREVEIEFFEPKAQLPRNEDRMVFNRYLEQWYNRYGAPEITGEPLKLVSLSCFKEEFPEVIPIEQQRETHKKQIPDAIRQDIYKKLAEVAEIDMAKIDDEKDLSSDLGLDSLDAADMLAFLDHKYEVESNRPGDLLTVRDLLDVAMGEKISEEEESPFPPDLTWKEEPNRPNPHLPQGKTIPESFLISCAKLKNHAAIGDASAGVLSYNRIRKSAFVLAEYFKTLPGENIGVMIPASAGVYVVVLACYFAKKRPVMLNWTVGPRNLTHTVNLAEVEVILTSRRFLERAETLEIGDLDEKLLMLEDIKQELSLKQKLTGLFNTCKKPEFPKPDDTAVILFTSGTENLPKAVPLSHKNILENQRAALSCIDPQATEVMIGCLPPFHSFGFSVTGFVPLLSGFRGFYSPDPTDSKMIATICEQWKVTMICLAPSFYRNLVKLATPEQLQSVRYFVTGAEKAPQELYRTVEEKFPNGQILEGYGITECAPMVSMTRPEIPPRGVGQPIPGVELCVIHLETEKVLPQGESGEVCIKGPNVFSGYLGKDAPNPFIEINGERWYRSGDIGRLDQDNFLLFEGRLKRFVKIGGEMLSLNSMEEVLMEEGAKRNWYDSEHDKHPLAICALEEGETPQLILVTTFALEKEEANRALREGGLGRIAKVSSVKRVEEIPLTGTGKVHLKGLIDLVEKLVHD